MLECGTVPANAEEPIADLERKVGLLAMEPDVAKSLDALADEQKQALAMSLSEEYPAETVGKALDDTQSSFDC